MITKEKAYENICRTARNRLNEIYSAGVPDFAVERLEKELEVLADSKVIPNFEIYRTIADAAKKTSVPMQISNGSFIVYLIGYMGVNPLAAHYYCSECGRYEGGDDYSIIALDLPLKVCSCGGKMKAYGISIPFECVWGTDRSKEFQNLTVRTSESLIPYAKKALEKKYGKDRVIATGIKSRRKDGSPNPYWSIGGFAILPDGVTENDLEEEIYWLENGEPCLDSFFVYNNNYDRVSVIPSQMMDIVYACQNATGIFASELIEDNDFKFTYNSLFNLGKVCGEAEYLDIFMPASKKAILNILSASHSTFNNGTDNKAEYLSELFSSESFEKYPVFELEDFITYFPDKSVSFDKLAKGYRLFFKGLLNEEKFNELFGEYDIDPDFVYAVSRYKYIFPRSHNAVFLHVYMILLRYSKADRKMYMNVTEKILGK